MAFATKTDYCGLTAITELADKLVIKEDAENVSVEKYQPQGEDGSFLGTEVFGADSAPTNSYGVKGNISLAAGKIKLNKVTTIGTAPNAKSYALESITITTAAGAAPTVAAVCQEIEAGAADANQCHYSLPALAFTTKQHAQILFGAFTISGTGCVLTDCSATAGGTINKDKVAGVKISSDINSGVITVSGNILQNGSTAPTITAADGWVVTQPPNCTNPETAYKTYAFELQKVLAKDVDAPSAS